MLSAEERGWLGDGVEHTTAAQCWRPSCDGSLPWQVERIVAAREAAARAEALREAADAWSRGAWSDVMLPKPTPPAVPVIAYANRMGDWLRGRAREIGGAQ